jgi:hypothetical protein
LHAAELEEGFLDWFAFQRDVAGNGARDDGPSFAPLPHHVQA